MARPDPPTAAGVNASQGSEDIVFRVPMEVWDAILSNVASWDTYSAFEINDHQAIVKFINAPNGTAYRTSQAALLEIGKAHRWLYHVVSRHRYQAVRLQSIRGIASFKNLLRNTKTARTTVRRIEVAADIDALAGRVGGKGVVDEAMDDLREIIRMCVNLQCFSTMWSSHGARPGAVDVQYTMRLLEAVTQESHVRRIEINFDLDYRVDLEHLLEGSTVEAVWLAPTRFLNHGANRPPTMRPATWKNVRFFACSPTRDTTLNVYLPNVRTCVLGQPWNDGPPVAPLNLCLGSGVYFLSCNSAASLAQVMQTTQKVATISFPYEELVVADPTLWPQVRNTYVDTVIIEDITFIRYPSYTIDAVELIKRLTESLRILTSPDTLPALHTIRLCFLSLPANTFEGHFAPELVFWTPWNTLPLREGLRYQAVYGREDWYSGNWKDIVVQRVPEAIRNNLSTNPFWWLAEDTMSTRQI